jgi:prolyl 4-hydroxylase
MSLLRYDIYVAILNVTDVDRLPLVSSAIINVDQDVDEPWPVEVYSHDGKAYNVSMEPGDMVLYESHTVLHGRPFPLKGRYYVSLCCAWAVVLGLSMRL